MLENHRLAESNLSNISAYERVVNPVNENLYGQQVKGQGPNSGYPDNRARHTTATLVNNYVWFNPI